MNDLSPKAMTEPTGRTTLICFPYAGGSPTLFQKWGKRLGGRFDILAPTLPGRGTRMAQPPFTNWDDLLGDIIEQIDPWLKTPHVLFGHSFGGRIAYELAQRNRKSSATNTLIISGCRSPQYPQKQPLMHRLTDDGFRQAIKTMDGTPRAVLENSEILRLMLPTVRADIMLSEIWKHSHASKISAPIHVILGSEDTIESGDSVAGWSDVTSSDCTFHKVRGGHFNLDDDPAAFTDFINQILEKAHARH